eukprot:Pgem_evm1s17580
MLFSSLLITLLASALTPTLATDNINNNDNNNKGVFRILTYNICWEETFGGNVRYAQKPQKIPADDLNPERNEILAVLKNKTEANYDILLLQEEDRQYFSRAKELGYGNGMYPYLLKVPANLTYSDNNILNETERAAITIRAPILSNVIYQCIDEFEFGRPLQFSLLKHPEFPDETPYLLVVNNHLPHLDYTKEDIQNKYDNNCLTNELNKNTEINESQIGAILSGGDFNRQVNSTSFTILGKSMVLPGVNPATYIRYKRTLQVKPATTINGGEWGPDHILVWSTPQLNFTTIPGSYSVVETFKNASDHLALQAEFTFNNKRIRRYYSVVFKSNSVVTLNLA